MSFMSQIISNIRPVVALLTDFGLGDGDVGVMKGVIASIASDVQIIDISHDVAPQNIASGAWILAAAYRYFPEKTVFVCVVDPGVGSSRSAIAIHAGNWFFVGPDNGLFSYVLAEQPVHAACVLSHSAFHLPRVSSTFHGRDIFAPVGAYLARGVDISEVGVPVEPAALQRIDVRQPARRGTEIDGQIVHVDRFGNLITSIPIVLIPELFSEVPVRMIFPTLNVEVGECRRFFAEGSDREPFIYGDSSGYVGVAVRNGSAAKALNAGFGTPVMLVIGSK